jgi:hypothetical protein
MRLDDGHGVRGYVFESGRKMMWTYESTGHDQDDKAQLETLRMALNGAKASLRLDDCRLWTLRGKRGYASTWGDGKTWCLFAGARSPRAWTAMKQRLAFCQVTQDGDEEGVFRLNRLPTPEEAAEIRVALGIRQTREAGFVPSPFKADKTGGLSAQD